MLNADKDFNVKARTVESVALAPGEELVSIEGVAWVTASDSGRDIILGPGDRIAFPKKARAVVGGLLGRSVKVRRAAPAVH